MQRVATKRQTLGELGERHVAKHCRCPRCKRLKSLVRLPANFKCADLICDFCGYLAQVKTAAVKSVDDVPKVVLGAAWKPQNERMQAGIYFPLFLVLVTSSTTLPAVYYLSANLQGPEMFIARAPLSATARRAGWTGFNYNIAAVREALIRLS